MLTFKCVDISTKPKRQAELGIVKLMTEHYEERGIEGNFTISLYRKTGGGGQDKCRFMRVFADHPNQAPQAMYQVRPHDRDSTWLILVQPTDRSVFDGLVAKEKAPLKSKTPSALAVPAAATEPEEADAELFPNKACFAKVVSHQKHGFTIGIETKGKPVEGFVSLADLPTFNQKEMNKYPVGKKIKVLICDPSKSPVECSTRVETLISTTNSKDVFTGVPNPDGSLSMNSYLRNFRRHYALLGDFGVHAQYGGKNLISKDEIVDLTTEFFKKKYEGTKTIEGGRQTIFLLMAQYVRGTEIVNTPCLSKNGDNYSLTEFAWTELDLIDPDKGEPVAKPQDEPTVHPEPGEEQGEAKEEFCCFDHPEEQSQSPKPATQPTPQPKAVPALPDTNPMDLTKLQELPDPELDESAEPFGNILKAAATYFGKASRLAEVKSQLSSLQHEEAELEQWLEENEEMRSPAAKMAQSLQAKFKD